MKFFSSEFIYKAIYSVFKKNIFKTEINRVTPKDIHKYFSKRKCRECDKKITEYYDDICFTCACNKR